MVDGSESLHIDDVVDELYGLSPAEFVRRRGELSRAAKEHGDRAVSVAIAALRKPTRAAWAVNQWVRHHPDSVAALTELGAELVAAQRRSAAAGMRSLSERRQEMIGAAIDEIRDVADADGVELSESVVREITQTLRAAVADEDVRGELRRGCLVASAEYSGFGPAGVFAVPDVATEPVPAQPASTESEGAESVEAREAALEAALAAASAEHRAAARAVDEAESGRATAIQNADRLAAKVDAMRDKLGRLEAELRFATRARDAAEVAYRDRADELDAAHARVVEAQQDLDA